MKILLTGLFFLGWSLIAIGQCSSYPKPDPASNSELRKLCEDDQKVRTSFDPRNINWTVVSAQDAEHRNRVRKMIDGDELHTADDYFDAGLIFQHGDKPDDFLLAHTLAVIAAGKGHSGGTSLAAVSLDRYLQSIKQPQIYGTQYSSSGESAPMTQEPYNPKLITDTLRKQIHVESLQEQQKRLEELNKKTGS
jgi:hypothetical protein